MSVIVGEQPQATTPTGGRPTQILVVLIVLSAAAVLAFAGPSATQESEAEIQPPVSNPALPPGWTASGSITARFLTPALAGEAMMIQMGGDIALLSADGSTRRPELPGLRQFRGVVSADNIVVAYGDSDKGPALWITTDTDVPWQRVHLPWDGSVQAVSVADRQIVVLGTVGSEWVSASSAWPPQSDDADWRLAPIDPPGTVVFPVADGFVARSLEKDEWLHSTDGSLWASYAEVITHPVGEVAAVVAGPTGLELRMPGDPRTVTPPEWPVSALWRNNGRIWIQTPSAAWWSSNGRRWHELPFDEESGFPGGRPVLLPFADRAIIAVGPTDLARRDLFTWHVGD